ncbi:rCG23912, isoform CRA_a [Rattus norvegicus]|uniref:RCG23912, isoform CRA_a n=1 Tax=Rattus norvegicus TaxID=10116 RepID=A6JWC3_RAT|nr:rCG23912, isoform CRA_a [Rattus norvegicus]
MPGLKYIIEQRLEVKSIEINLHSGDKILGALQRKPTQHTVGPSNLESK